MREYMYVVAYSLSAGDLPDLFVVIAPSEREAHKRALNMLRERFPPRRTFKYVLWNITALVEQYAEKYLCGRTEEVVADA